MTEHSEKPNRDPGCNFVALRDYFTLWLERLEIFYNRRFEDLDAKTILALAAADKAVTKAELATEKRFEGVNEFRASLNDANSRMIPREEANSKFENMQKDINTISKEIQERRNQLSDRTQDISQLRQSWIVPVIISGLISAAALVIALLK